MKTTLVSTAAIQNAAKLAIQRAQSDIIDRQVELTTGKHADIGLALGSQSAKSISLGREVARLDTILDSNALVTQRLSSSQEALGQMAEGAQTMLNTLLTAQDSPTADQVGVVQQELSAALGNFTSLANLSVGGEYLFAGVNTDVKPLNSYTAEDSPAKEAFDQAFTDHFNFGPDAPEVADITADELDTFLEDVVEPMFSGDGWQNWSKASDTDMSSRIRPNEVIDSSSNANGQGFRDFAMTAVVGLELLDLPFNAEAQSRLGEKLVDYAGRAISGLTAERTELGVAEGRVAKADVALKNQKDVIATHLGELEGVDPYEAATQINTLLTQMEASYALTARIQQLSLLNYL